MYCLKKSLMKKIIDKRKKNQPFDFNKAEEYTLEKNGDGTINNSYYFSAHSILKKESLYVRLGQRNNGISEVWAFYNKGEKNYCLKQMLFNDKESPLIVKKDKLNWSFSFNGILTNEEGKNFNASFDCKFIPNQDAIDFFSHMPSIRTATAMAQEKWTKEFFSEVQKNNSVHYEQEGTLTGTVNIDSQVYSIELPCVRDHSYGKRIWGYMNNHLWLMAIDDKCQLNFSMVSYPSMTILEVGSLHQKNQPVLFVKKAHYDRSILISGKTPQFIQLELLTENKTKNIVTAKLIHSDTYEFENGAYYLTEGIAEYTLNGICCRGILEVGFNGDSKRYMNGRDLRRIKE